MLTILESMEDFIVYYDVSILGLGVVLMCRGHMIAYTSKQLKPHEESYPSRELELGIVVFFLQYLALLLVGGPMCHLYIPYSQLICSAPGRTMLVV